jgi:hypothetical protein
MCKMDLLFFFPIFIYDVIKMYWQVWLRFQQWKCLKSFRIYYLYISFPRMTVNGCVDECVNCIIDIAI